MQPQTSFSSNLEFKGRSDRADDSNLCLFRQHWTLHINSSRMSLLVSNYCSVWKPNVDTGKTFFLLFKGAGHKEPQWPRAPVGHITGTCLYGSLYFMTKQPCFVPGTEFTLLAISTWPEYPKSLLEPPQHLSTREAIRHVAVKTHTAGIMRQQARSVCIQCPTKTSHSLVRLSCKAQQQ